MVGSEKGPAFNGSVGNVVGMRARIDHLEPETESLSTVLARENTAAFHSTVASRILACLRTCGADLGAVLWRDVQKQVLEALDASALKSARRVTQAVLRDLRREREVVLFGRYVMTHPGFVRARLRLLARLFCSPEKAIDWKEVGASFLQVADPKTFGKTERRELSGLMKKDSAFLVEPTGFRLAVPYTPTDLLYEWMQATFPAVRQTECLQCFLNADFSFAPIIVSDIVKTDDRFRLVGDTVWLEERAAEIERRWLEDLEASEFCLHTDAWCRDNGLADKGLSGLSTLLERAALKAGFQRLGPRLLGRFERFSERVERFVRASRRSQFGLADLKRSLDLDGVSFGGRALWAIRCLALDAGYVRTARMFLHLPHVIRSVVEMLESGVREPIAWSALRARLLSDLRLSIGEADLRLALRSAPEVIAAKDGVYSSARRATVLDVQKAVYRVMDEAGFAGDTAVIGEVARDGLVLTEPELFDLLSEHGSLTRVFGGWAPKSAFARFYAEKRDMKESLPDAWAKGLIGWTHSQTLEALVRSIEVGRSVQNGTPAAFSAELTMCGADLINSRLRFGNKLRALFPPGRFVAVFRTPSGAYAHALGDSSVGLLLFPFGFLQSLRLAHGDHLQMQRTALIPAVYELILPDAYDREMREHAAPLISELRTICPTRPSDAGLVLEEIFSKTRVPMTLAEIMDAMRLAGFVYERRTVLAHLSSNRHCFSFEHNLYAFSPSKKEEYRLKVAELESRIAQHKEEAKRTESALLAFRGENARLKNENREMRRRLSGLEIERYKIAEANENAEKTVRALNLRLKALRERSEEENMRLVSAQSLAQELEQENRRLKREAEKPWWRRLVEAVVRFLHFAGGSGVSG